MPIQLNTYIKSVIRKLKSRFFAMRYPNLELGYGVVFVGRFRMSGQGKVTVGAGTRLKRVRLRADGNLTIGKNCFLNGTSIVCLQSVTIGDNCIVSDAYITDTDFHNIQPELRHAPPVPQTRKPVVIESNVWIGDNGVILKGCHIHQDAVIGSYSVVRGTVPARALCIGNPAVFVKTL